MLKNNCSKKVNDSKEFTIFGFLRRPSSRQNYTFFRLLGLATEPRSSSTGLFLFPNPKKWPHTFCKHLLLNQIGITSKFRLATKGKFFSVPSLAIPTLNLLRTNGLNWYTLLKLSQKKDSSLSTTEAADPDHSQNRKQCEWTRYINPAKVSVKFSVWTATLSGRSLRRYSQRPHAMECQLMCQKGDCI